jgi:hypothetical protein
MNSKLENDKNDLLIKLAKLNKYEKEKIKLEKENQTNFEQYKNAMNKSEDLLKTNEIITKERDNLEEILKKKEEENLELRKCLEDIKNNSSIINSNTGRENIYSTRTDEALNNMEQLNKLYEQKNNENEELKKVNKELLEKIKNLEEKNKKNEDNENKIKINKSSNRSVEYNLSDKNSITKNSNSSDQETKIEKITKRYKEYKELYKASENQCHELKEQIKELEKENALLRNDENRVKEYEELNKLYNIAFDNYKPKKKEQIDAFHKLNAYFGKENSGGELNLSTQTDIKKKKGLFGGLFNK